jgi:hypothetical protein
MSDKIDFINYGCVVKFNVIDKSYELNVLQQVLGVLTHYKNLF